MLKVIATMDSLVIRALLVAGVGLLGMILSLFGVDDALFSAKAIPLVDGFLTLLTAGGVFYAAYFRATRPNPPLTEAAVEKTIEMVRAGKLQSVAVPPGRQGGFASVWMLLVLALMSLMLVGCQTTKGAYQAAESPDEVAFVVMEHYDALLGEAATFAESPDTPADAKAIIKSVSSIATPLVLELRPLSDAYVAAVGAVQEAEDVDPADAEAVTAARVKLSTAVGKASVAVANLIRALRDARAKAGATSMITPPSYWSESNFILRLERMGGAS